MAIKSSGQLSLRDDIRAEFNNFGTTNISLDAIGNFAGLTRPHAMSEFYGLSAINNTHFWRGNGVNDYLEADWRTSGFQFLSRSSHFISFWIRQNNPSATSSQLWDFNPAGVNSGNSDSRYFMMYFNANRAFRIRHRNFRGNFLTKEFRTADGATGLNGGAWTSGNRGNTNGDGWTHIVISYNRDLAISGDAGQREQAIRMFWNGQEITTTQMVDNRAPANPTYNTATIGSSVHNVGGGNANVDIDEWAFYANPIPNVNVAQTLWNGGTIARAQDLYSTLHRSSISFNANGSDPSGPNAVDFRPQGGSLIAF